jgi:hypothetical protein
MKNLRLKVFLVVMYITSLVCFVISYNAATYSPFVYESSFSIYEILFFVFLSIFVEYFIIKYDKVAVSPGFAVTVASILYFGVFWSLIINCAAVALRVVKHEGKTIHILNMPIYKTLFNISTISLSIFASGMPYFTYLRSTEASSILNLSIGFMILVLMFLITNTLIVSILVTILSRSKFLKTYVNYISFGFLDIVFPAPFGVILLYLYKHQGAIGAILFLVPIILLRYVFKLYTD